jgi:hypothetical protein
MSQRSNYSRKQRIVLLFDKKGLDARIPVSKSWSYAARKPPGKWSNAALVAAFRAFLPCIWRMPADIRRMLFAYVTWELALTETSPRCFSLPVSRVYQAVNALRCIHISAAVISMTKVRVRTGFEILDPALGRWIQHLESRILSSQLPEIHCKFHSCISGDVLSYTFDIVYAQMDDYFHQRRYQPVANPTAPHNIITQVIRPFFEPARREARDASWEVPPSYHRIDNVPLVPGSLLNVGSLLETARIDVSGMTCFKHRNAKILFTIQ